VCGPVVFEKFDEVQQRAIAFDGKRSGMRCAACRLKASQDEEKERRTTEEKRRTTWKLECSNCEKLLLLSAFPEAVQKRVLLRGSTSTVKALCTECRDDADHKVCIECKKRKRNDDFGRTKKRAIHSRCIECEDKKQKISKAAEFAPAGQESSTSMDPPGSIFSATPQDHTGFSFGSTHEAPSMRTKKTVKEVVEEMNEITEEMKELTLRPETYCCSVCRNDVSKKELYLDGENMQWRSNGGDRERIHFWCLSCAFPTCANCGIQSDIAVRQSQEESEPRPWYLEAFLKELCPICRLIINKLDCIYIYIFIYV